MKNNNLIRFVDRSLWIPILLYLDNFSKKDNAQKIKPLDTYVLNI